MLDCSVNNFDVTFEAVGSCPFYILVPLIRGKDASSGVSRN